MRKACWAFDPTYKVPKGHDVNAWYTVPEMEDAMKKAGLKDVRSEVVRVKCLDEKSSAEEFTRHWNEGKNPAHVMLMNSVSRTVEAGTFNGTLKDVLKEFGRIIREEYDDGRSVYMSMDLAVGRK